jgi:uncharacterized protein (DUF1697 family)
MTPTKIKMLELETSRPIVVNYRFDGDRMTAYVALLRAVNVGGTGKLPMADLKKFCDKAGFTKTRTYIASGNALFESERAEAEIQVRLSAMIERYAGGPVGVLVRTAKEMAAVVAANPFADRPGNRVVAIFIDTRPPKDALKAATGVTTEAMALGRREIYVHYPDGQAHTKLKIPAARAGTARNMNTVVKLAELVAAL